jgi:hypothetical protein
MNLWGFGEVAREVRRATGLQAKAAALLGPPRWSPRPLVDAPPPDPGSAGRHLSEAYALLQFLFLLGATVLRLDQLGVASLGDVAAYGAFAALTLTGVNAVLEGRAWARRFEVARLIAVGLAAVTPGLRDTGLVAAPVLLGYAGVSLLSFPVLTRSGSPRAHQVPTSTEGITEPGPWATPLPPA